MNEYKSAGVSGVEREVTVSDLVDASLELLAETERLKQVWLNVVNGPSPEAPGGVDPQRAEASDRFINIQSRMRTALLHIKSVTQSMAQRA